MIRGASVSKAEPKPKAEPKTVTASYRIRPVVRDAIKTVADRERVKIGALVELAMLRLIDDLDAGTFELPKAAEQYTLEYSG